MKNSSGINIREPAVAGSFYPSEKRELEAFIESALTDTCIKAVPQGRVRALISPHAGYIYSGYTAAKGFACLKDKDYENVIVIAPSHRVPFYGMALPDYTHFRTPAGDIKVNTEAVADIVSSASGTAFLRNDAHEDEHALEVQLPFVQKLLPEAELIPVVCGHISDFKKAAGILKKYWNENTLWVISSDFTHYGRSFRYTPFTDDIEHSIEKLDMQAIDRILDMDPEGFSDFIEKTGATVCGAVPILVLLNTVYEFREKLKTLLVDYTNSGRMLSDFSHSVSYASILFFS
jgi:AmmeMemoRadiSam system protein B